MRRFPRLQIDRRERLHQRRQRLHRDPHDDVLAVGYASFESAGAVGLAEEAALVVTVDLVVRLRSSQRREREPVADLDSFHRLRPHQRRREPRVEPVRLRRV